MNSDKKQTKQIVVFGVLLAIFAGYGAFKFMGKKAPPTPQAHKPAALALTHTTEPAKSVEPDSGSLALGVTPSVTKKDPFTPSFGEDNENPSKVAELRPRGRAMGPLVPNIQGLPNIGAIPRTSGFAASSGESGLPLPEFQVTGVIVGDKNVAIVQFGQDGRQVVREGQFIGGRYRVLSINKGGVVLKGDGRTIHLKLGGAKNAS